MVRAINQHAGDTGLSHLANRYFLGSLHRGWPCSQSTRFFQILARCWKKPGNGITKFCRYLMSFFLDCALVGPRADPFEHIGDISVGVWCGFSKFLTPLLRI